MKEQHAKQLTRGLGALTLAGLLVAGYLLYGGRAEKAAPVARVGQYEITVEQLALRQQHADIYYPGSGKPEVALAQLIQGYLAAELMKQQHAELDRATWVAEKERIDRQTRDPATLARIKAVYGTDEESFLYVGVLPDFAQSRLYKLYRASPKFAEQARMAAIAFLDEAEKAPAQFMTLAEKHGANARRLRLDATKGLFPVETEPMESPPGMKDMSPKSAEEMQIRAELEAQADSRESRAAASLHAKLASLAEGQVYGNTLEAPEAYETARLVERVDENTAIVEMAAFVKPDFGKWFWAEAGKVPVQIADEALKQRFIDAVSWSKNLSF